MNIPPGSEEPVRDRDLLEPATVVEDMASAVDRVRRMARTVFHGDAALFAEEHETPT